MSCRQKFTQFVADPSGVLFKVVDSTFLLVDRLFNTLRMKLILSLRGIHFGRHCFFYGKSFFRRSIGSKILIGDDCRFRSSFLSNQIGLNRPCFISTFRKNAVLEIGHNVGLSGCVIGCAESISIGNNVLLGGNSFITDFDWHDLKSGKTNGGESAAVVIENNVFLGANTIVLKGTTIGEGSIIGANSVVSGNIPRFVVAAGNPCKIIRNIET